MALGAKCKLGFIDGTLEKPAATDANHQKWIHWLYGQILDSQFYGDRDFRWIFFMLGQLKNCGLRLWRDMARAMDLSCINYNTI